jgi:predicted peroxiredoxin
MSQSASLSTGVVEPANEALAYQPEQAVVIVTSASLQTQSMAMVLSRALQEQGVQLNMLLCDKAGDLAIDGYQSAKALAPKGMKPEVLLQQIIEAGAQVAVCALYLPNSAYQEQDLCTGVSVAQPAQMAQMMRNKDSKVFTF